MTKGKHSAQGEFDENCNIEDRCPIGLCKPETPVKISGEPQIYDLANIVRSIFNNPTSPITRYPVSLADLILAKPVSYQKELILKLAKSSPRIYIVLSALKNELKNKPNKKRASIQNITRVIRSFSSRQNMLDISVKYERYLIAFFIKKYYPSLGFSSKGIIKELIFSKRFPRVFRFQYQLEENNKLERLTAVRFGYSATPLLYGSSLIKVVDNIYDCLSNAVRDQIEEYVKSIEQGDLAEESPCVEQTTVSVFSRSMNYRSGL